MQQTWYTSLSPFKVEGKRFKLSHTLKTWTSDFELESASQTCYMLVMRTWSGRLQVRSPPVSFDNGFAVFYSMTEMQVVL